MTILAQNERPADDGLVASGQRGTVVLRGVSKRFGSTTAVDGVDLTIPGGSYVVLLGPSGCGKTTLLRMVGGHEVADAGDILLDGVRLNDVPAAQRDISTVFQHYALFPHKTVYENVEFGLKMRRLSPDERQRRVNEALAFMDLTNLRDRLPKQLSGGQQQRVALARALVTQPTVLLLDEPLGDLDRLLQLRMRVELRTLQRRLRITFIHVTHNQEEALAIADQIVVMQNGQIRQVGSPQAVYRRPTNLFTASFMGDNNILAGRVASVDGDGILLECEGLRLRARSAPEPVVPGQAIHAAIRASTVRVRQEAAAGATLPPNCVAARATFVEYLGDTVKLHCQTASGLALVAKVPEQDPSWQGIREDETDLMLEWDEDDVQLLTS
ncbi:MAG: ABC transporter ATP-binding protein [Sphaerobacter sp.]|nr:ABC transporter ATP-binding protein [Sphaerobacter sp.]